MARFRGIRFSTRSLLIGASLVCIALGWRAYSAAKQRQAMTAIQSVGGQVQPGTPQGTFSAWLRGQESVSGFHFLGPAVSDADIEVIARNASEFGDLMSMTFVETTVSETGREELQRRLPNVEIRLISPILDIEVPATRRR